MEKGSIILWLLAGIAVVSLPIVGVYFRLLNTLMHEIGHAMMSLFMGGGVRKIELSSDTSGLATTTSKNWFSQVMITGAGYPFASMMAALSAYIFSTFGVNMFYLLIVSVTALSLLIWVRNVFGFLWVSTFFVITVFAFLNSETNWSYFYAMLVLVILLIESVRSSIVILRLSFKQKNEAGDARDLALLTKVPTLVWGILFFIQSLLFFVQGTLFLWKAGF